MLSYWDRCLTRKLSLLIITAYNKKSTQRNRGGSFLFLWRNDIERLGVLKWIEWNKVKSDWESSSLVKFLCALIVLSLVLGRKWLSSMPFVFLEHFEERQNQNRTVSPSATETQGYIGIYMCVYLWIMYLDAMCITVPLPNL